MRTLLATSSCFESTQHGQFPLFRWLSYYYRWFSKWDVEYILCVNDGIACLPVEHFFRYTIDSDLSGMSLDSSKINVQAFHPRFGRPKFYLYIGWWRSIAGMIATAMRNKLDRIIYIEWDFFLLSNAIIEEVAETRGGYTAYWSPYYQFPECAMQIIHSEKFDEVLTLAKQKIHANSEAVQDLAELSLPWSEIRKHRKGDRYPELGYMPDDADYAAQVDLSYVVSFDEEKGKGQIKKVFSQYAQLPSKQF